MISWLLTFHKAHYWPNIFRLWMQTRFLGFPLFHYLFHHLSRFITIHHIFLTCSFFFLFLCKAIENSIYMFIRALLKQQSRGGLRHFHISVHFRSIYILLLYYYYRLWLWHDDDMMSDRHPAHFLGTASYFGKLLARPFSHLVSVTTQLWPLFLVSSHRFCICWE